MYIDIDIYNYLERKLGKFDFFWGTFICLENIVINFERLSHNLMENKKDAGMSDK